jgi:hypothetical protein
MYYEVFIPSPEEDGYDVTITVDADNWMFALKSGLERIGEGEQDVSHVMCDIKDDDTIHVTDAKTDRVFVMTRLEDVDPDSVETGPQRERSDRDSPPVDAVNRDSTNSGQQAEPDPAEGNHNGGIVSERKEPSETDLSTVQRRQPDNTGTEFGNDPLTGAFMGTEPFIADSMELEEALDYALEMSMKLLDIEQGGILFVDESGKEMYTVTTRGVNEDRNGRRIKYGRGPAGFSTRFGVGIAVSDIERDPRFYRDIHRQAASDAKGYLCAPLKEGDRTFGCIELETRQKNRFEPIQLQALTFIGTQLGRYLDRHVMENTSIRGGSES